MRTFTDGSGADSTAAALDYVAGTPNPLMADLFQFKTLTQDAPWSQNLLLTNASHPLKWGSKLFVMSNIQRGPVESKIGLDTLSFELDWYPGDAVMYGDMSILQSFAHGLWDNATVTLWRLLMPSWGDGDTLGACEMFTGRLAEHSFTRLGVHLKINSATELLDQQLPPNVVEASNPQARYGTGQPPSGLSVVPVLAAATGSTESILLLDESTPNPGEVFSPDVFDFGYIWGVTGDNTGIFRTIRKSSSSFGHNQFYLYEPLPFPVTAGDTFKGYVPQVRAASTSETETHYIPSSSPYTITVTGAADWIADGGVKFTGGAALDKVPANPAAGQYACDLAGNYFFAAANATNSVDISYQKRVAGFTGFPFVPQPEASL